MDFLGLDKKLPQLQDIMKDVVEKSGGNLAHEAVDAGEKAIADVLATVNADATALLQPVLERWDRTLDVLVQAEQKIEPFASLASRLNDVLAKVEGILK
jgi:hypothetical protein